MLLTRWLIWGKLHNCSCLSFLTCAEGMLIMTILFHVRTELIPRQDVEDCMIKASIMLEPPPSLPPIVISHQILPVLSKTAPFSHSHYPQFRLLLSHSWLTRQWHCWTLILFLLQIPPGTKSILSKHHFEPITSMLHILCDSQILTDNQYLDYNLRHVIN